MIAMGSMTPVQFGKVVKVLQVGTPEQNDMTRTTLNSKLQGLGVLVPFAEPHAPLRNGVQYRHGVFAYDNEHDIALATEALSNPRSVDSLKVKADGSPIFTIDSTNTDAPADAITLSRCNSEGTVRTGILTLPEYLMDFIKRAFSMA